MDIITQMIGGSLLGLITGMFIRKFSIIVLYVIGGFISFLLFLQGLEIATIHWDVLMHYLSGLLYNLLGIGQNTAEMLIGVPVFGLSFATGFFIGYSKLQIINYPYTIEANKYFRVKK